VGEVERRKKLFNQYPGVDKLSAYNAVAKDPLRPWVMLFDEATALLGDKRIEKSLRKVALRARKYGLWAILAGQDWKASSLDSAIRNQLSTTVQFRAKNSAQSRVLLGTGDAAGITTKGRAIVDLPGQGRFKIQTPWIGTAAVLAALQDDGPQLALPEAAIRDAQVIEDDTSWRQDVRIRRLHAQGLSKRKIEMRVFGYNGGAATNAVNAVLDEK